MHENNILSLDLNLLKVLNEIERHGSVTAAADALGLGQPAVSQALSRLRISLHDELFVRGPGGMVPTPRMKELTGPLRTALGQIEQSLFGEQSFNEAETDTRFILGASDYTAAVLVTKIMQLIADRMPSASLSVLRADKSDSEKLLADGKIDIALGMFADKIKWIRRRHLFHEEHICVYNSKLLDLPEPLTVDAYASQDHLLVSLDGSPYGFVDKALEKLGHTRRVAMTTPYFLQCAYLLEQLPLIATLPKSLVLGCSVLSKMAVRQLPIENPGFYVSAAWRKGDERNPRSVALQEIVITASKQL